MNAIKIDHSDLFLTLVSKARQDQKRMDGILDRILARSCRATEYLGCDRIGKSERMGK